jgi:hypothetical protein
MAKDFDKTAAENVARSIRATADYIEANPLVLFTKEYREFSLANIKLNPLGINWQSLSERELS